MASAAQALAAGTGEGQCRGIQEDDAQLAEQITPALDKMLLDQILNRTRGERRGAGLL